MKRGFVFLVCLSVLALCAAQAVAAPLSTVGRKNFERGRRAEQRGAPDEARTAFIAAADALQAYVDGVDAANGDVFASDLVMYGMSLYKAGRYDQAAAVLARTGEQDPDVHEAFSYGGLAWLRLGNTDKALEVWGRYPLGRQQTYVTDALREQALALRQGGAPAAAIQAVEQALLRQDAWNLSHSKDLNAPWPDQCHGVFWWRTSDAPCDASSKTSPGFPSW